MRTRTTLLSLATVILLGTFGAWVHSQQPMSEQALRAKADKLHQDGNFKEAYALYKQLMTEPRFGQKTTEDDVKRAVESLTKLNRAVDIDALLDAAADNNNSNWRALRRIAQQYSRIPNYGIIIAGEFKRAGRGQGRHVNSIERDHARALQLFDSAIPLVEKEASQRDAAQFYLDLANAIMRSRSGQAAWRLQHLTDVETLPDYGDSYRYSSGSAAPVDEEGNAVFHFPSASWGEAETDGQRWRFALQRATELDANLKNQVSWQRCRFLESQFSVTTLRNFGWIYGAGDDEDAAKGILSLQTLGDDETVCRLATGVKRFKLPETHNYIAIYQQMAKSTRAFNSLASDQLARIYTNRMQFKRAAAQWRESIKRFGGQNSRSRALEQIVGNWGNFEPQLTQPAGKGAEFQFRFRNGKRVTFTAKRIKFRQLLADVKAYLKSNPTKFDWYQQDIANLGYRLARENSAKYVGEQVASWSLDLKPREGHFDRRVTVASPLQKGGAYMVTAQMDGGNRHSIIAWIADIAVIRKRGDGSSLYLFADPVTGKPVPSLKVDFFGYRRHVERQGRKRIESIKTREFSGSTDRLGMLAPASDKIGESGYQWVAFGETSDGRFAHLGFSHIAGGRRYDPPYDQTKAFCVTDRPVYRPKDTVQFKCWIKRARYDASDETSAYAGRRVTVEIYNPKGERALTKQAAVDRYGGVEGEYELPKDVQLGMYSVRVKGVSSSGTFRIEEYKKPEYEVTIEAPDKPIILGETFTAKVKARYFHGAPVQQAQVKLKVLRSDHSAAWYPYHPWDWYYGPGFWWFSSDYAWYRGSHRWLGCIAPIFGPRFGYNPPELVMELEREIGEDGTVEVEIDSALAKLIHGNKDHRYSITAEVRDASRRTIVGQGSVIAARKPYMVYTWLDRGYYQVGDTINASIKAQTIDSRPIQGQATARLLRIEYDGDNQPTEREVQRFESETDAQGGGKLTLQAAAAGQYRLSVEVADADGNKQEGGYIFTVRGDGDDGSGYRFESIEIVPDRKTYAPGQTMKLQINTDRANSVVYLFLRPLNGVYLRPQVIRMQGKTKVVDVPVSKADMPNFFVEAVTVSDGRVHSAVKSIAVPPEKRILTVSVLPDKDEYRPRGNAKVKLHVTDHEGENFVGSTAVAVYDRSLEYIAGGSNAGDIRSYFWKWLRQHYAYHDTNLQLRSTFLYSKDTPMRPLGAFGDQVADVDKLRSVAKRGALRRQRAPQAGAMLGASASIDKASELGSGLSFGLDAEGGEGEMQQQSQALVEPDLRSEFADTAYWVASVDTDENGIAEVEFDMPDNLTSWKIQAWGVGHGGRVGSGDAEVVTSKNVIVRLQAPRFFTEKDEVVLSAVVHNYLDNAKDAEVSLVVDGPIKPLEDAERSVTIDANGEARIDWRVRVTGEGEAQIRMIAKTDEESDAMQLTFPCQVFGAEVVQSYVGSITPGEQSESIAFDIPLKRRPEQSRLEVRYSPSLAGAMVDALPYLADYPYGCTEQTLNRFLPAVITQRVLQRMNLNLAEIKDTRTNLNAQELGKHPERAKQWKVYDENPVFDEALLADMVAEGVKRLTNMQNSDGGWGWFSGPYERSGAHTTVVVLRGLMVAQANDVNVDEQVLRRGLDWLQRYQKRELQKLKNFERNVDPKKAKADNLDALTYQALAAGKRDNVEMRTRLYRDRVNLSAYAKVMFALALQQVDDADKLAMLVRNIRQFQVDDDENETSYLDLGGQFWWYWHGDEIEANAFYLKLLTKVEPEGQTAPRLVKYLLNNRKHATYWKSTRDTAVCVEAFADYLKVSGELNPDMTVEVWLDGEKKKEVAINRDNLFTFDNRLLLTGDALEGGKHTLELRRSGRGPVYFNAYVTNFTQEDRIPAAGLEVKVERAFYRLTPKEKTERAVGSRGQSVEQAAEAYERTPIANLNALKSGDLVEVELKLISKNDYEYVLFEDLKAAGLEPVDVRSGYMRGGSMLVYQEFRDNRVGFFMRRLPRGEHSLSYRLRAETPGKFAALPAQAYGMYAPELRGNTPDAKVVIED